MDLFGLPETGCSHLNTLPSCICLLLVELYIIIFQGEVQVGNEIPQNKGESCGGMRTDWPPWTIWKRESLVIRGGRPSEEARLSLGRGLQTLIVDCVEGKILGSFP